MLSSTPGMGPYTRVVSVYERFAVLSTSTVKREVEQMLKLSRLNLLQQQQQHRLLDGVCGLMVKSGEWRRALAIAVHLPLALQQTVVSAVKERREGSDPGREVEILNAMTSSRNCGPVSNELLKLSNEELVRMAFGLQRHGQGAALAGDGAGTERRISVDGNVLATQQRLFRELSRRRRYKELVQCVTDWGSKGLIPIDQKTATQCTSNDTCSREHQSDFKVCKTLVVSERSVWGATRTSPGSSCDSASDNISPFNAEEALRALVFNSTSGNLWEEAMQCHQSFFIHMLREPTAALQLVRKVGAEACLRLLLSVLAGGNTKATTAPLVTLTRTLDWETTPWDTVASLSFALRPHITHEKKVLKIELLQALVSALRRETKRTALSGKHAPLSALDGRAAGSSVEGLCAPLAAGNEAQVRFIGLPHFFDVALAMCDCGVPVTNALVQCILLCLGDSKRCELGEGQISSQSGPLQSQRELIMKLGTTPRNSRWLVGLKLLQMCGEQRLFVVATPHLRCLLSGLQSISIRQTWDAALSAASSLVIHHCVFPDENSMEKLMLNLHVASWRRAFEVLRLYERKHVQPSAIILRDLHVVAMKHSSWDMVLNVMQRINDTGHQQVGFMNYVYCLRAYGCAGKWSSAVKLLAYMKRVPYASVTRDAFNEKTVAVPVLAMMERNHWEEVIRFTNTVLLDCGAELTCSGVEVARAAMFLSLVHIGSVERVAAFLNNFEGQREPESTNKATSVDCDLIPDSGAVNILRAVVVRAAQLQTLLGMEHLNAPIRLVFELLTAETDNCKAEQLTATGRGRSVPSKLYLPPQHIQLQHKWLATTLGGMTRDGECFFCVSAQQAVAEAMSSIGAAPVYLKAALL